MNVKAEAFQEYNQAAVIDKLFASMPEIVRALASPLANVDKITVVSTGNGDAPGMNKITGDMTKMAAQVPALFETLSGMQLSELLGKVRQIGDKARKPVRRRHNEADQLSERGRASRSSALPAERMCDAAGERTSYDQQSKLPDLASPWEPHWARLSEWLPDIWASGWRWGLRSTWRLGASLHRKQGAWPIGRGNAFHAQYDGAERCEVRIPGEAVGEQLDASHGQVSNRLRFCFAFSEAKSSLRMTEAKNQKLEARSLEAENRRSPSWHYWSEFQRWFERISMT